MKMQFQWIVVLTWCVAVINSFDLGPTVRIAQCRSQCLRKFTIDGSCDWYSNRGETVCSECWQNCESLENQWEDTRSICENEQYPRCPACQTACLYRKTRVEEIYLPSMLPAPRKGPIILDKFDVAVVMRRVHGQWKESGYYPGRRAPSLRSDTWVIVAVEDGFEHYSWQEWTPTLESLKQGPLYEATISWKDMQSQLKRQQEIEHKRFNDRVRQFFLEKYGEKILQAEWRTEEDTKISEDVFRRFFFRRKKEPLDTETNLSNFKSGLEDATRGTSKESYVVSWEPETGGLMGNQVTDSNYAQISLLPGTKYLVRIASNEGPGSFPIEIDTRPHSIQAVRIIRKFDNILVYPWDILAASGSAVFVVLLIVLLIIIKKARNTQPKEDV